MNLAQMSTFVRAQADTDVTDAPDANLEVYARAAYRDIQSRVFPWPDKLVEYQFATSPGNNSYGLASLTGGSDMRYVVSVYRADEPLEYVSPDYMLEMTTMNSSSGTPTMFTIQEGSLKMWPAPSGSEIYYVRGYRDFAEWPSGSTEPDLPRGFDEAICWYMLARFYQAQEDLELATRYMADFDVAVNRQIESSLRSSSVTAGPRIFGGETRRMSYSDWVKRGVEG